MSKSIQDHNKDGEKYTSLEKCSFGWFFHDKKNDAINVTEQDRCKILPLSKQYCRLLWNQYISKKNRHPMQLAEDEWLRLMSETEVIDNFTNDWNDNNYDGLRVVLKQRLDYAPEDEIYFFWNHETAVETTWEIFLKYWINFLFEDEGPILINPKSGYVLSFGPDGSVLVGKR